MFAIFLGPDGMERYWTTPSPGETKEHFINACKNMSRPGRFQIVDIPVDIELPEDPYYFS